MQIFHLLKHLGVDSLQLAIGGSLGGMQVLEWALLYPDIVQAIAPIAISGRHSAWCIGLNEAQRQAIYADPHWQGGYYHQPPSQGLAAARMMAMHTYRSWQSFALKYHRQETAGSFAIVDYLQYQGQKLVQRFDANTYITLSLAMDSHDLTRPNQTYEAVLKSIQQPALVVGITSDILYPPIEQEELACHLPRAQLVWLESPHGHDAFLIDIENLYGLVVQFRQQLDRWKIDCQPNPSSYSIMASPAISAGKEKI